MVAGTSGVMVWIFDTASFSRDAVGIIGIILCGISYVMMWIHYSHTMKESASKEFENKIPFN